MDAEWLVMTTLWCENAFGITHPLWEESTRQLWISLRSAIDTKVFVLFALAYTSRRNYRLVADAYIHHNKHVM